MRPFVPVAAALALAVSATALGCGDDGKKDAAAKRQICVARIDLERRVEHLRALSLSGISLNQLRDDRDAVLADLKKIVESDEVLDHAQRKSLEQATEHFGATVRQAGDAQKTLTQTAIVVNGALQQLLASLDSTVDELCVPGSR